MDVADAGGFEGFPDVGGIGRYGLDDGSRWRGRKRLAAKDETGLFSIGPTAKPKHGLVCLAADDHGIDGLVELVEAVRLAAAGIQKIERAVGASDKTIERSTDEDGGFHR